MALFRVMLGFTTILLMSGCAQTYTSRFLQSQFAYPNHDLTPDTTHGRVAVDMSKTTYFYAAAVVSKDDYDALVLQAKEKANADFLTDFILKTEVTSYIPLPITTTKYTLEAYAANTTEGVIKFKNQIPGIAK